MHQVPLLTVEGLYSSNSLAFPTWPKHRPSSSPDQSDHGQRNTGSCQYVEELSAEDPQGRQSGYGWGTDSVGYSCPSKPGLKLGTLPLTCIYPDLSRVVEFFCSGKDLRPNGKQENH